MKEVRKIRRSGNFIIIGDTWVNVSYIVTIKRGERIEIAPDGEATTVPDGYEVAMSNGVLRYITEEEGQSFLDVMYSFDGLSVEVRQPYGASWQIWEDEV